MIKIKINQFKFPSLLGTDFEKVRVYIASKAEEHYGSAPEIELRVSGETISVEYLVFNTFHPDEEFSQILSKSVLENYAEFERDVPQTLIKMFVEKNCKKELSAVISVLSQKNWIIATSSKGEAFQFAPAGEDLYFTRWDFDRWILRSIDQDEKDSMLHKQDWIATDLFRVPDSEEEFTEAEFRAAVKNYKDLESPSIFLEIEEEEDEETDLFF